jgi:poly-gamma-glutamate capsule biosynthesis protein CapA/YwtB (metallophosphatase superfamily)
MEDEAPKSAVELAMARFKKQDADEGVRDRQLTDAQKHEIAEVRTTYAAKLAQEEILFKTKMQGLMDSETRQDYHDKYRRDVERINHERDKKIEKIRGS